MMFMSTQYHQLYTILLIHAYSLKSIRITVIYTIQPFPCNLSRRSTSVLHKLWMTITCTTKNCVCVLGEGVIHLCILNQKNVDIHQSKIEQ